MRHASCTTWVLWIIQLGGVETQANRLSVADEAYKIYRKSKGHLKTKSLLSLGDQAYKTDGKSIEHLKTKSSLSLAVPAYKSDINPRRELKTKSLVEVFTLIFLPVGWNTFQKISSFRAKNKTKNNSVLIYERKTSYSSFRREKQRGARVHGRHGANVPSTEQYMKVGYLQICICCHGANSPKGHLQ